MVDEAQLYYVLGRSDDVIKISGKRVGPSEIETLLLATGHVSEAAVVGLPDDIKGSALIAVCVLMPGVVASEKLSQSLCDALVHGMGASFRPKHLVFVRDLPKTRNMKIMRRVVRSAICGQHPGDLSSLANPDSVQELQAVAGRL